MHLTLRQLQIFLAIAETGSTTAAGARLPLSQSATSAALAELEAGLGVPLFDRLGKRLLLNETGRALLDPARALLDDAAQIEHRFGGARDGQLLPARVRLGASTTIGNYLMPERMAQCLVRWPAMEVSLRIGNTREIVEAVLRLEVDAGVIEGPCHESELEVLPWRDDPLLVLAGATHPLANGRQLSIAELRSQRWLLREVGSGTRESVEQALLPHLGGFEHSLQLGSTEAIKQGAVAGLGITCLSRSAVQDQLALGKLVVLTSRLPALSRPLYRIRHRGRPWSDSVRHLLDGPHDGTRFS